MTKPGPLRLTLQLRCGDEVALCPGKAALLEAIAQHGSIAAAAKTLKLSYRNAWLLADAINRCWAEPLVWTRVGGRGGAGLTAAGQATIAHYRALEQRLAEAAEGPLSVLTPRLLPTPREAGPRRS